MYGETYWDIQQTIAKYTIKIIPKQLGKTNDVTLPLCSVVQWSSLIGSQQQHNQDTGKKRLLGGEDLNRKWTQFKAQYATEICDAFVTLLKKLSQLSPWWYIIKSPNGEIINNDFTLADYLGYDHLHFMILLEIAGLASLHNKHNGYCVTPKDWVFFFNEYQLNNEVKKYQNRHL